MEAVRIGDGGCGAELPTAGAVVPIGRVDAGRGAGTLAVGLVLAGIDARVPPLAEGVAASCVAGACATGSAASRSGLSSWRARRAWLGGRQAAAPGLARLRASRGSVGSAASPGIVGRDGDAATSSPATAAPAPVGRRLANTTTGKLSPKRVLQPTALLRAGSAGPGRAGADLASPAAPPPARAGCWAGDGAVMRWARGGSPCSREWGLGSAKSVGSNALDRCPEGRELQGLMLHPEP
jgi:hypothetical protein